MAIQENFTYYYDDLTAQHFLRPTLTIREIFLEEQCNFLVEQDVLQDYHILNFHDNQANISIDAWGFLTSEDIKDSSLALILCDFTDSTTLQSQSMTEFRKFLLKAKRFVTASLREDFYLSLFTVNAPAASLAEFIFKNQSNLESIKIIGVSNQQITSRANTLIISDNFVRDIAIYFDVWDFPRFSKIQQSLSGRESVDLDFKHDYNVEQGFPILKTAGNTPDIESFLFVIPGGVLASMYEQWNERLLEQNPRTFLQFTGKVNKGIRNTILNEPEKFFSYNNGISAVAEEVVLDSDLKNLEAVRNFQIVNGGQTTASIYNAMVQARKTKREINLDNISVMVKLSVIKDKDRAEDIIPKISEYSNTQNKVNPSAFSVRHIFHKTIEKYSRNIWTPSKQGVRETHWYYERVQGQYKNAINLRKTKTEKVNFENENPKIQVIKREELAKFLLTFDLLPHKVCLGAQKGYAEFCVRYLKTNEEGEGVVSADLNEAFFQEVCAKAILFRSLEKRIKRDIRFVAVPYTLAYLAKCIKTKGYTFDFQQIWKNQWDINSLVDLLEEASEKVIEYIQTSMPIEYSLPSEWGKRELCWAGIDITKIVFEPFYAYCISASDDQERKVQAKKVGKIDRQIDALEYIVNKGDAYWKALENWGLKTNLLTAKSLGILSSATNFRRRIPSDAQARAIRLIEEAAIKEGFFVSS